MSNTRRNPLPDDATFMTHLPYSELAPITDLPSQFSSGLNAISGAILFIANRQKKLEEIYGREETAGKRKDAAWKARGPEEVKESEVSDLGEWKHSFMAFREQVQQNTRDIRDIEVKIDMSK